jgi:hypothetical protein
MPTSYLSMHIYQQMNFHGMFEFTSCFQITFGDGRFFFSVQNSENSYTNIFFHGVEICMKTKSIPCPGS